MPDQQTEPIDIPEEVRILHLSDLHAGRGFESNRWSDLLDLLDETIRPQVVIVSGDMVNSPTRSDFKQATNRINELREKCGSHTRFIFLPGNHDTRIFGIFSVSRARRITSLILAVLVISTWLFAAWRVPIPYTQYSIRLLFILVASGALVAILLMFFLFWCVNFERHFPPQGPVMRLNELGLDVLIFDSSSDSKAYWAEGIIRESEFVAVRQLNGGTPTRNFRLAVLHHHALPIPYEAGAEPMMVLRNAGAFLREISLLKVALVLHGHRHRYSFSRVTVNADDQLPFQIGVLSTGSVTSGDRDAARLGHSFSVVDLNRWGNARITRYQSKDGSTFRAEDPFMARSIPVAAGEFFSQNALVNGCCCKSIRENIVITSDGDAHRTTEYWGFTVKRELDRLPGSIGASVTTGQVERVRLGTHNFPAGFSPGLEGNLTRDSWDGTLTFGVTLKPASDPIDFSWERDLVNAFAMSIEQYECMYKRNDQSPVESTTFRLRHVPTAELVLTVELPLGIGLDGDPKLGVFKGKNAEPELTGNLRKACPTIANTT